MNANAPEIESPCIGNCCLDLNDVCMGCFRTVDEIKGWANSDDARRLDVLDKTEQRRIQKNRNTTQ